ncbi:hypothetical protein MAE_50810 [Microcystis aeruginosa NIES-843]|uniref:Uncharacterized protein n=1 Tax=Microcystis aeruginosa (strain NIES-843 / IAM M-2473) TaxID=449447 RepID=B0JX16_MICAN|nr:hypothetical protein MAE_50810 [Microcystis aeruginosa NIES-843]
MPDTCTSSASVGCGGGGGALTIGRLGVGRLPTDADGGAAAVAAGVPTGGFSSAVIVIFGCRGKGAKGSLRPRLISARFWSGSVAGINPATLGGVGSVAGCTAPLKAGGWAAGGLGEGVGVGVSWLGGGD